MRTLWTVAVAAVLVASWGTAASAAPTGEIRSGGGETVAGSYLVVLRPGAVPRDHGGTIVRRFSHAVQGFELTADDTIAKRVAADPAVAFVERNAVMRMVEPQGTQPAPPSWGLDRIDQRNLPLDNSYTFPNTGAGVHAYIMGTGLRFTHTDFGGRAVSGFDAIDGGSADDCNGVSTHLGGTVGGANFGVAKGVTLVAVRNVDCNGAATIAQVVAGIDWVTANSIKPAVALLAVGGPASTTFDNAVTNSIASGVSYVVTAGSSNSDACMFSPGRVPAAITVSATDMTDTRASFSNFGPCLDIFAPGVSIPSDWFTSDTATATLSGTSMAAAHVAGGVALILAEQRALTPAQVAAQLVTNSTKDVVINAGAGSPNRLLFVNTTGAPVFCTGTNGTNVAIPDSPGPAVTSQITIAGCAHSPSTAAQVEVHIVHPFRGDLVIDLLAPDSTAYRLKSRDADSGDNIDTTYVVNLSSEAANGNWRLRVRDRRAGNVGTLDSWTIRL